MRRLAPLALMAAIAAWAGIVRAQDAWPLQPVRIIIPFPAGSTTDTLTRIVADVTGSEEKIHKGRVPARSVVIPGTRAKTFASGTYQIPCALIIGQRKQSTDQKTSLNSALRDFAVSV